MPQCPPKSIMAAHLHNYRYGVTTVGNQAEVVPGPLSRRGPPNATGVRTVFTPPAPGRSTAKGVPVQVPGENRPAAFGLLREVRGL